MAERRCRGTNAQGEPCKVRSHLVDPDTGYCAAHDPDRPDHMQELAERGGRATKKRHSKGIDTDYLPPLNDPSDVEVWMEELARARLDGRIENGDVRAVSQVLRDWLKAHEQGSITRQLTRLREAIEEARETGEVDPILEAAA